MGKKRSRKTKTSKGVHTSVACRVSVPAADKILNKLTAWKKGKNPWVLVSIEGREITVRANQAWGDPRRRYNIYGKIKEGQQ